MDSLDAMNRLEVEVEPAEAGFDHQRLARLDRHFDRYVESGRLPGWLVLVSRRGRVVHLSARGNRDGEEGRPTEPDTIFRVYSMTKPVTSVAAMMLYKEGAFELTTPVSRFIPSFGEARVYQRGPALRPLTSPAAEPIRMWHVLPIVLLVFAIGLAAWSISGDETSGSLELLLANPLSRVRVPSSGRAR